MGKHGRQNKVKNQNEIKKSNIALVFTSIRIYWEINQFENEKWNDLLQDGGQDNPYRMNYNTVKPLYISYPLRSEVKENNW